MEKLLEKKLKWFTQAPDLLIELYGQKAGLIWGKIRRYCLMKDGMCYASVKRMADELDMSEKTFRKYLKPLLANDYVRDLTPKVRYKPHIYIATDKIYEETEKWAKKTGRNENLHNDDFQEGIKELM